MQIGDFVEIDYIGRVKDTGEIFDLTIEETAKRESVYNPKIKYGPITIIVDAGLTIKGIDNVLKEMKVGEKRKIEIPPEKSFGERRSELVKLIPLSVFKGQNINPTPGNIVSVNRINGRIVSVDGGRVKVDFNHPLAGKTLEYEIEIKNLVETFEEKIKSIVNYFTTIEKTDVDVRRKEKDVEIEFKKKFDLPVQIKENISQTIKKWVKEIDTIKFVEIYK